MTYIPHRYNNFEQEQTFAGRWNDIKKTLFDFLSFWEMLLGTNTAQPMICVLNFCADLSISMSIPHISTGESPNW